MDYVIRPLTETDQQILWEMLYQALQTSKGAPSRDILKQPEYARYVEGWGRTGDTGFVVSDKGSKEVLGAVWCRLPAAGDKRSADPTGLVPELAFAVKPGQRKRGLGAALMTQLVKANPHQSAISMRASANNPAVRLYERFGFEIVSDTAGTVTMRREI
ncbi:MAG TPA: GNAT family N-acetyltransferase [Chthoniobacterales bacterium]|jgi:ribosomal protein S18 acetylase RimI-like enzyme|nr:GNAT family N-acetyltransferase [Chthoniobacterales bacterium]